MWAGGTCATASLERLELTAKHVRSDTHALHEVMEAGGREFDPRPGHYSRMSF